MNKASRWVVLAVLVSSLSLHAQGTSVAPVVVTPVPDTTDSFYLNQLIVELDPAALATTTVEQVVTAIQSASTVLLPGSSTSLISQLGNPVDARLLAITRLPPATANALPVSDPAYRLQNTIVLTYVDDDATARAQMVLARLPAVKSQSRTTLIHYSADPLVPIVSDSTRYQWGLYTINAIQSTNQVGIWGKTTGSAYVAMLDNGLKTAGGVHEDLAGNYRSQFSWRYNRIWCTTMS